MEKRKIQTTFVALISIKIPCGITGGGWNAVQDFLHIPAGNQFKVSTNQTPNPQEEDKTILLHHEERDVECQFDTLGRLIASNSAKQI